MAEWKATEVSMFLNQNGIASLEPKLAPVAAGGLTGGLLETFDDAFLQQHVPHAHKWERKQLLSAIKKARQREAKAMKDGSLASTSSIGESQRHRGGGADADHDSEHSSTISRSAARPGACIVKAVTASGATMLGSWEMFPSYMALAETACSKLKLKQAPHFSYTAADNSFHVVISSSAHFDALAAWINGTSPASIRLQMLPGTVAATGSASSSSRPKHRSRKDR